MTWCPPSYLCLICSLSECTAHRHMPNCSDMWFYRKNWAQDWMCNDLHCPTRAWLWPPLSTSWNPPVGMASTCLVGLAAMQCPVCMPFPWPGWSPQSWWPQQLSPWRYIHTHTHAMGLVFRLQFGPYGVWLNISCFSDGQLCSSACTNDTPYFPNVIPHIDPQRTHDHICFLYVPALCVVVELPPWWWIHIPENRLASSWHMSTFLMFTGAQSENLKYWEKHSESWRLFPRNTRSRGNSWG